MKSDSALYATWSLPGDTLAEKIRAALTHYQAKQNKVPTHVFMRVLPDLATLEPIIGTRNITIAADKDLKSQDIVITCQPTIDTVANTFSTKQLELF